MWKRGDDQPWLFLKGASHPGPKKHRSYLLNAFSFGFQTKNRLGSTGVSRRRRSCPGISRSTSTGRNRSSPTTPGRRSRFGATFFRSGTGAPSNSASVRTFTESSRLKRANWFQVTRSKDPGRFPQGETVVEYQATDFFGNAAFCNITINVQRNSFLDSGAIPWAGSASTPPRPALPRAHHRKAAGHGSASPPARFLCQPRAS